MCMCVLKGDVFVHHMTETRGQPIPAPIHPDGILYTEYDTHPYTHPCTHTYTHTRSYPPEYDKRKGTLREWIKQQKAQDPGWQVRACIDARMDGWMD